MEIRSFSRPALATDPALRGPGAGPADGPAALTSGGSRDSYLTSGAVATRPAAPAPEKLTPQFPRTRYDKNREFFHLDSSQAWKKAVGKIMNASVLKDDIPPISRTELKSLTDTAKPGDAILCGNNGSFIHGIVYVGSDPQLQAQIEARWGLAPGALNGEHLIVHALSGDNDADQDGVHYAAAGVGVVADTLERYTLRHPRDMMVVLSPKGASDADRAAIVQGAKQHLGKDYDWTFNTFDDGHIYCTELITRSLQHMATPPHVPSQLHPLAALPGTNKGIAFQEMVMNDGLLASPDMDLVWVNRNFPTTPVFKEYARVAEAFRKGDAKVTREEGEVARDLGDRLSQVAEVSARTGGAVQP